MKINAKGLTALLVAIGFIFTCLNVYGEGLSIKPYRPSLTPMLSKHFIKHFGTSYHDQSSAVAIDDDGNVHIAGNVVSGSVGSTTVTPLYLVIWSGGRITRAELSEFDTLGTKTVTDVASDNEGNIFLAANGPETTRVEGGRRVYLHSGAIIQYNPESSRVANTIVLENSSVEEMKIDKLNRCLYVAGRTQNITMTGIKEDVSYIAKYNLVNLERVWTKIFSNQPILRIFSTTGDYEIKALAVDDAGNLFAGGKFKPSGGSTSFFLAKINPANGNMDKHIFFAGEGVLDAINDITANNRGEILAVGATSGYVGPEGGSNAGYTDMFAMKFDNDLHGQIWSWQGGGTNLDSFHSVRVDRDDNVFAVGGLGGGDEIYKFDTNGMLLRNIAVAGESGVLNSLTLDSSGNIYAVGYTSGTIGGEIASSGGSDIFMMKFNNNLTRY